MAAPPVAVVVAVAVAVAVTPFVVVITPFILIVLLFLVWAVSSVAVPKDSAFAGRHELYLTRPLPRSLAFLILSPFLLFPFALLLMLTPRRQLLPGVGQRLDTGFTSH